MPLTELSDDELKDAAQAAARKQALLSQAAAQCGLADSSGFVLLSAQVLKPSKPYLSLLPRRECFKYVRE